MKEKEFIKKGINQAHLDRFLGDELSRANYSHVEISKTPVSTRITIYAQKPGLVIGRGGHRIKKLTKTLKQKFDIDNPELDIEEVTQPDKDAEVIAKNMASWLEKGGHPKRVGYTYLRRAMEAGAIGVKLEISGKLSGNRGRTEKFMDGYVKESGETAKDCVEKAYTIARTKPGVLGVKVSIMKEMPEFVSKKEAAKEEEAGEEGEETVALDISEDERQELKEILDKPITEIRDILGEEDYSLQALLELEKEGKDRKSLLALLNRKLDQNEAETDADNAASGD